MAFKDLDELLDDRLPLLVKGKTYQIPATDAETGLWCQRLLAIGEQIARGVDKVPRLRGLTPALADVVDGVVDDETEVDLERRLLGPALDEMRADGVSWERIKFCSQTAMFWNGLSRAAAEAFWNSGGDPKASAPNRASKRSTATAGAPTTRKRASTSGTRSPRTRRAT